MNRRNFFRAAGAVMLGGLVGAQAQAAAPTYKWDIAAAGLARRRAHEDEDRALRLERLRADHEAQLEEMRRIDAMRLEQMEEVFARGLADVFGSYG